MERFRRKRRRKFASWVSLATLSQKLDSLEDAGLDAASSLDRGRRRRKKILFDKICLFWEDGRKVQNFQEELFETNVFYKRTCTCTYIWTVAHSYHHPHHSQHHHHCWILSILTIVAVQQNRNTFIVIIGIIKRCRNTWKEPLHSISRGAKRIFSHKFYFNLHLKFTFAFLLTIFKTFSMIMIMIHDYHLKFQIDSK